MFVSPFLPMSCMAANQKKPHRGMAFFVENGVCSTGLEKVLYDKVQPMAPGKQYIGE